MEIKSEGKSIKEMLAAGADPKQMLADLQNQILAAQKDLKAEKEVQEQIQNNKIKLARQRAVYAMRDYMAAIGFVENEEESEDFLEMIDETFEEMEGRLTSLVKLIESAKKIKSAPAEERENNAESVDSILNRFLKTL